MLFRSQGFCLPRRESKLPMAENECSGAGHQAPTLAAASPSPIPRETWEGCSVLLDINDGDRLVFARLSPAAFVSLAPALLFVLALRVSTTSYSISLLWLCLCRTLKIGNKKCSLGPLMGCPFGALFRVENGPGGPYLARCSPSTSAASSRLSWPCPSLLCLVFCCIT